MNLLDEKQWKRRVSKAIKITKNNIFGDSKMAEISLFDLPKEQVRIKLKPEFREKIFFELKKKYGSFGKISKALGLKRGESTRRYRVERSGLPLPLVLKIARILKISEKQIQKNTIELKTMKSKESIKNPKLPFRITPEFALVVGAVLGDGGIEKNKCRIWYFNREKEQIESFTKAVQSCFGEVNFARHHSLSGAPCVIFPKIIGVILKTIGLEDGNKNYKPYQGIPKIFLGSTDKKIKIALLQRLYDDDGTVFNHHNSRCVSFTAPITYPKEQTRQEPQILIDIKKILEEFEIKSKICNYKKNAKNAEEITINWEIRITGKENQQKFYEKIGFGLQRKQEKLKQVLDRYVEGLEFYPRNEATIHYLQKLKELRLKNIELNAENISNFCKRNQRHIREILTSLLKKGLISREKTGNKFAYSIKN
ncbi:MAG: LAGLIDADG family homing endonuclease [Candidatus ainarchaeum sp.]|nr:LAGLIDADG family homing endonuclease [Candidatus ainarchaeum sp.]